MATGSWDARLADYAQAQVRVADVDGRTLVLVPRPDAGDRGEFPFGDAVAHVLTAFDPGPRRLDPAENAARQRALVAALPAALPRFETVGGAADGSYAEAGVLVIGLGDDRARALAARWDQDAIFRWTRDTWSIVPCDGSPPTYLGWAVHEV